MIVRSSEPASPTRESDRPAKGPPHGQRGFCRRPVKAKAAKPLSKPRRTPTLGAADGGPPASPRGNFFFRQTAKSRRIYWLNFKNSLQ